MLFTNEQDKGLWEENQRNKSFSGIEIRDKNGKLCNFITIRHDEILENRIPHRISIRLNEDSEPILPPAQTFEEIIQAKRRHQMLLYGSGNSTSSAILADRTRRVAAARQVASSAAANRRRPMTSSAGLPSTPAARSNGNSSSSSSRRRVPASGSRSRNSTNSSVNKRKKPKRNQPQPQPKCQIDESQFYYQPMSREASPSPTEATDEFEPTAGPSGAFNCPNLVQVVPTSLKDLNKPDNPLLKSVDPKEVKLLLKSAPPGASILLSNGAVIKKSRRGGARAGAGRKRSRPLPMGAQQLSSGLSRSSNGSSEPLSPNSSSSILFDYQAS